MTALSWHELYLKLWHLDVQEEEAEEEGEAQRMAEWDRAAADAAYKAEVERAQQQQKLWEEQLALV